MKKMLAAAITIFLLISCEPNKKLETNLLNFIPANSEFIVQSSNFSKFIHELEDIPLLKQNPTLLKQFQQKELKAVLTYFKPTSALLSFTDNNEFLFIAKEGTMNLQLDSIANKSVETITENEFIYKKFSFNEVTLVSSLVNNTLLLSNSKSLLQNIVNNPESRMGDDENFTKAMAAADKTKTSLFLNFDILKSKDDRIFPKSAFPFHKLSNWWELDFDNDDENLFLNGIATWDSSGQQLLEIFKDIEPQPNQMATITPINAEGFISFSYKDFSKLNKNLKKFKKDSLTITGDNFLNYTNEAGLIFLGNSKVIAFSTPDKEIAINSIPDLQKKAEFHELPIYKFPENLSLQIFSPLFTLKNPQFCCFLNNFMIIAESRKEIETLIVHYQNNTTLTNQDYFQKSMAKLAGNSSILAVANSQVLQSELPNLVAEDYKDEAKKLDFSGYPLIAVQFIQNKTFAHLHILFNRANNNVETRKEIVQNSTIKLNANLGTAPVLVENHNTHHPEIAVQDEKNVFYLFTTAGKELWKKKLDGRILGKIQQVDIYKNGNLQLIFTTPHSLYLLDRNGNEVKPFPVKFNDEITQPLAVFDYDHNKKYRFVITQNRELLMLNSGAKTVSGFGFEKASSEITQTPKHLRIRNKDYIVFPEENGKLDILSRQGKPRIPVKEKLAVGDAEWYQNAGDFVSLGSNGKLIRIDQNGKIQYKNLGTESNEKIAATKDILAILAGNVLHINTTEITLDYGLYTEPQIFEVSGKSFVTITDLQAKKVYVFDNNAQLIPGFPKYGTSAADLSNFDGGNTELTVKGDDNSILIYSF